VDPPRFFYDMITLVESLFPSLKEEVLAFNVAVRELVAIYSGEPSERILEQLATFLLNNIN
jgi:hypothetical protein